MGACVARCRFYKWRPTLRGEWHKPPPTPKEQSRAEPPVSIRSSRLFPSISLLHLLEPGRQAAMCPTGRYLGLDIPAARGDLRPAFDVLDADRDGRISRDDLKSFYAAAGGRFDDDDLAAMIAAADADRDGFVQYDAFERLLGRGAAAGSRSAMEDAFHLMDCDGDGVVGFEDLKAYLSWAGMPAADEDVSAMIGVAGGGDGGVGIDALARLLAVDMGRVAL